MTQGMNLDNRGAGAGGISETGPRDIWHMGA